MFKIIKAYVRCSTSEDKQDITRQIRELEEKYEIDKIYSEYISSQSADRQAFELLVNELERGDTVVASEVSRLSRSTVDFISFLDIIKSKKCRLIVNSMIIDCRDDSEFDLMTETTLKIMSIFSELERKMLSERVKSGLKNARAKGITLGRPKLRKEDISSKFLNAYELYKLDKINVSDLARLCDISRTTVYKYIKLIEDKAV